MFIFVSDKNKQRADEFNNDLNLDGGGYALITLDSLITSLKNAQRYCEAHNQGNEGAMLVQMQRSLESIRSLPSEAFASHWTQEQLQTLPGPSAGPQVLEPSPPDMRLNTTENLRQAQGPAQWLGNKPGGAPEPGDKTPPPKPFVTPDLPVGVPGTMQAPDPDAAPNTVPVVGPDAVPATQSPTEQLSDAEWNRLVAEAKQRQSNATP